MLEIICVCGTYYFLLFYFSLDLICAILTNHRAKLSYDSDGIKNEKVVFFFFFLISSSFFHCLLELLAKFHEQGSEEFYNDKRR
jgi:hypothetical protein